jgi:hypothetical protein
MPNMETTTKSWRHLFSAVLTLGVSEGSVHERLRAAYETSLTKLLPDSGLPDALQGDFEALMVELSDLFQSGKADGATASSLAKRVVALYDSVAKQHK